MTIIQWMTFYVVTGIVVAVFAIKPIIDNLSDQKFIIFIKEYIDEPITDEIEIKSARFSYIMASGIFWPYSIYKHFIYRK